MAESLKSLKNKEYINRRTVKGMEHSLREYIEFLDEKNLVIDYHLEEGLPEIRSKIFLIIRKTICQVEYLYVREHILSRNI